MSDLIEKVAKAIYDANPDNSRDISKAAIATVLGEMMEPSPSMWYAGNAIAIEIAHRRPEFTSMDLFKAMLRAFAAEHNIALATHSGDGEGK